MTGLAIGWLDLQVTEVAVTIIALLSAGLLCGLVQPVAAWRWAVLITIGLPALEVIALLADMPAAEPVQPDVRVFLVALAFSLLGTYAGVFIRRAVNAASGRSEPPSAL